MTLNGKQAVHYKMFLSFKSVCMAKNTASVVEAMAGTKGAVNERGSMPTLLQDTKMLDGGRDG